VRVFVLTLALAAIAWAQPAKMWRLEVQLVRVPASHSGLATCQILDDGEWTSHLRAGHAQILESGSLLGAQNRDGLSMVGGKVPIGYHDPRTGSYQVQYIDSGWKVDAKINEHKPGVLEVECVTSHALLAGDSPAGMPEQDVLRFNSFVLLKPGQTALVGAARGRLSSQYVKKVLPSQPISESDTILFALTVSKP